MTETVLDFENYNFGFVSPFGDSHKYNQIKDLSIYGIEFRYSSFYLIVATPLAGLS
jgi:hypothetical protein